jgi:hypothetical protein
MNARIGWRDLDLWPHQVAALEGVNTYLQGRAGSAGPSALVRMPTGTGKSGVIAVFAHHLIDGDVLLLSPWDALVDQLGRDVDARFWRRIGVDPPGQKKVVRLFPSTAKDLLTGESAPTVWISTIATLQRLHDTDQATYRRLQKRVLATVVDEGHYEPAPTWAAAVRELRRPTILFTATPYRNDFKVFEVDEAHCYFYSHDDAERERFLRKLRFESLRYDSPVSFVEALVGGLNRVAPPGPGSRAIVRCGTRAGVQDVANELRRNGLDAVGIHERFELSDGSHLKREVPNPETEPALIWVHQNKLIEGIDDASFRAVAFYDPLSSERAFVQQIGRVLRNPERKARQNAWVLHHEAQPMELSWAEYRSYDSETQPGALIQGPRDFARIQPQTQYVVGRFRKQFDVDSPSVHEDFDYPRSTTVFRAPSELSLDELTSSVNAEWAELDRDLGTVVQDGDTRIHAYIAVRNSPLLERKAFAEFEVGFTIYRRLRDYLFYYDSQSRTPDTLAELPRAHTQRLQRLYEGSVARLTSVSLLNTQVSRHVTRRRLIQAQSIDELGPDLADHAQIASTATGYTSAPADSGAGILARYVGFTRGRITDRSGGTTSYQDYLLWLDRLGEALDATNRRPLDVFDRYAELVDRPRDPTPVNILLDLDGRFGGVVDDQQVDLHIEDLCVDVAKGSFKLLANDHEHEVRIDWDDVRRSYRLTSPSLDNTYSTREVRGERRPESVVTYMNREQSFRVVPASAGSDYCLYVGGQFYRPRLHLWGRSASSRFELLTILHDDPALASVGTEKGSPGSATAGGWAAGSLFHLIDHRGTGTALAPHLRDIDLLVCDDMRTEIADFVLLDETAPRVVAIHAKAFPSAKPRSASALQEISAQALKNLAYLQPYSVGTPGNVSSWGGGWNGGTIGKVDSRIRVGGPLKGKEAWDRIRAALRDPATNREVWLVLGQGLSKGTLDTERSKAKPAAETVQILYSLQATWGAVAAMGARLRIFCSP